jgi:hypothetical protein
MERIHHRFLVYAQNLAICHGRGRAHTKNLAGQASLPKKIPFTHNSDRCLLAALGHNGQSHFAVLNIEDRVRSIPLREDSLLSRKGQDFPTVADRCEERVGVKGSVLASCSSHDQGLYSAEESILQENAIYMFSKVSYSEQYFDPLARESTCPKSLGAALNVECCGVGQY